MRQKISGTGGMILVKMLKECGVEYLFTNPAQRKQGCLPLLQRTEI